MTQAGIHEIFKVPIYSVQLDLDIKKLLSYCKEYENKDLLSKPTMSLCILIDIFSRSICLSLLLKIIPIQILL